MAGCDALNPHNQITQKKKIMATKKEESAITINVFGKMNTNEIRYFGTPYNIRNNCQIGQWAKNEQEFLGNTLDMAIIQTQKMYGKLGKSTSRWLQIFFIAAPNETKAPANFVCVTYLKTRSLSEFGQTIIELMMDGEPALGIFTGNFQRHSNELGNYYSVKFTWRKRTEEEMDQLKLIASFLQTEPILQDPGLPETMFAINSEEDITSAKKALENISQI
jgi:hypothetical protein